jgi:hypothetical protein
MVWGKSARGHIEVPSHLPPLAIRVGKMVGEDGGGVVVRGAGCEERVRSAIVG